MISSKQINIIETPIKKMVLIMLLLLVVSFSFAFDKIKYGNIPYGISIEEFLTNYAPLYDSCRVNDAVTIYPEDVTNYVEIKNKATFLETTPWPVIQEHTKEYVVSEKDTKGQSIYTYLYFFKNGNTSKLFWIVKRAPFEKYGNTEQEHATIVNNINGVVGKKYGLYTHGTYESWMYYKMTPKTSTITEWYLPDQTIVICSSSDASSSQSKGYFIYYSPTLLNEYSSLISSETTKFRAQAELEKQKELQNQIDGYF